MYESTIDVIRELAAIVPGTHVERMTLLALHAANDPVQMGHLADRVGISRGAMTSIIDRLVGQGLVKRDYDAAPDRRIVPVVITAKGRKAIAKAEKAAGYVGAA